VELASDPHPPPQLRSAVSNTELTERRDQPQEDYASFECHCDFNDGQISLGIIINLAPNRY
jgi:hypothetical protein